MRGTWQTTGGGGDAVAAVAVIAIAVVVLAALSAAVRAVAAIPAYVWVLVSVAIVAAVAGGVALAVRVYRREGDALAARAEQLRALPPPAQRISAPRRQALPPVEQHIHFHGVSATDVAAILASRNHPAEGDRPCSPSSS